MGVFQIISFAGGLSDYENKGTPGSFKFGANLDIRKELDSLSCQQALTDIGITSSTSSSISPSSSYSPSPSISSSVSPSISPSSSVSPSSGDQPSPSDSPSASKSPSASMSPSASLSPSSSISPSPSPSSALPSVFQDLVMWFIPANDGNIYGFGNTGKIYKIQPDLAVFQVYDLRKAITGASQKYSATGLIYLEFADDTNLHRKIIPGDPSWNDVDQAGTVTGDTWPKNNLTSAPWHTMAQVSGDVMIANNSFLAMSAYDDSYTNEALDLIPSNVAKALLPRSTGGSARVVIGTYPQVDPVNGVNGMVDCEVPLVQIGSDGDIYYSDFTTDVAVKRLIGGGKVNPGGMTNLVNQVNIFDWNQNALSWIDNQVIGNMAMMGFFESDPGKGGVYTAGRWNKNQPFAWNCEYQLDADEIGAVLSLGSITYVSYTIGGIPGVKVTDINNKATAIYEGLDFQAPIKTPLYITKWDWAELFFLPLPAGCTVQFWYRMDKEGDFIQAPISNQTTGDFSVTNAQKCVFAIGAMGEIFEPRVVLIPNGNETADIFRIKCGFV